MPRSVMQRVLAPITPARFARDHFQRAPLLVRGAAGKFDFLLRQDDFKHGLDRVTEIRAVFRELWQATIGPADIKPMIHAGATICVTGMERAHRSLATAARAIRRELCYHGNISFRSYLSPAGSGFDLHYDARVATALQLAGRKRWWYSRTPAEPFPAENSPHPLAGSGLKTPRPRDLVSVVLGPGDLLCLPAGTWHRARAETMSLSLNLAFDHNHGSTVVDVAEALIPRLEREAAWRQPLPIAPGASRRRVPPTVAAELDARLARLEHEIGELRRDPARLRALWLASIGR